MDISRCISSVILSYRLFWCAWLLRIVWYVSYNLVWEKNARELCWCFTFLLPFHLVTSILYIVYTLRWFFVYHIAMSVFSHAFYFSIILYMLYCCVLYVGILHCCKSYTYATDLIYPKM